MKRYIAKDFEPVALYGVIAGNTYRHVGGRDEVLLATDEPDFPLVSLDEGSLYPDTYFDSSARFVEVESTYIVEDDDEE